MISDHLWHLCSNTEPVTTGYAKDPKRAPIDTAGTVVSPERDAQTASIPSDELEKIRQCGRWGPCSPSDLFLKIYSDSIKCLETHPLKSMVSPSLMGSHGSIPLTIIAPLLDIVRHMANLVVRARQEVILVTCSWSPSLATRLIGDALRELSRRSRARGSPPIIAKIMFDKASLGHFVQCRQHLNVSAYTSKSIGLPGPDEIPNINLEVLSFHKPILGTLHAKFMVVDHEVAVVQSNNMENNDNMEMLTHLEGPIVNSIYDTALLTWGKSPNPPLPSMSDHATKSANPESTDVGLDDIVNLGQERDLRELFPGNRNYDNTLMQEVARMQHAYSCKSNETHLQAINRQLNIPCPRAFMSTGPEISDGSEFIPYIPCRSDLIPIALVSRPPHGPASNTDAFVPQNEAWLSSIRNAKKDIFIQTPDLNALPLYKALLDAIQRGVCVTYYVCLGYNDAGELMPGQGGTNEMFAEKLLKTVPSGAKSRLNIHYYVGKDQDRPIHQSLHGRSCHIKLLIVDGQIGIQGSGNQDTQSWYHSQEINVLIDSRDICSKWREGIERNQNTNQFGACAPDGTWRDENGNEVKGASGKPRPPMSWAKGVSGMIKKAGGNLG